jgi:excisionase family DNA binding protein
MARASKSPVAIQPRLLNVRQAAEYLGATIWYVRTIAWEKKVKSVMFGNRLLFPREELDAFVDRAKVGAA